MTVFLRSILLNSTFKPILNTLRMKIVLAYRNPY